MKVRVYDGAMGKVERHQYKGYVDRYSLYFPCPKKWQKEEYKKSGKVITGHYLGFSFSEDGEYINRCIWDEWDLSHGRCDNLGKKVKIETLPKPVQKWIRGYEKRWNDLIAHENDKKVQKAWDTYF